MATHFLLQDGEHIACGRWGQASTFISMVDCTDCRSWWESNEWAKAHTPQFNETLGRPQLLLEETELPECNFCHAKKDLEQIGDVLVCPVHKPSYERELDGEGLGPDWADSIHDYGPDEEDLNDGVRR